jgi:hypothetical protein
VEEILQKYKFKDLVGSLKKKYGAVPTGWEKELATSVFSSFGF